MADAMNLVQPFLFLRGAPPGEGLPLLSAAGPGAEAPARPAAADGEKGHLASASGDPDDLASQRWGLVATADERGQRWIDRTRRLAERRAAQQGEAPHVYRVAPGMTAAQAEEFVRGAYQDEVGRDLARLPRYLLLLGDADGVSWELQSALARHGAFPGRLALDGDDGAEAYVDKVLAWETASVPAREALYYAVRDGSSAVTRGLTGLLAPSREAVSRACRIQGVHMADSDLSPVVLSSAAALESEAQAMLSFAARSRGGLLVSLSHGVGLDRAAPFEARRAQQGALHVHAGRALGPADVAGAPFFEGGAWFFLACFSAGTPAHSVYHSWLRSLAARGYTGRSAAEQALAALPDPPSPFVAALPAAALASPRGPLAVFGHVDLAWSWSFAPASLATGRMLYQARHERFDALFLALLGGRRFGAALHELASAGASVGQNLLALYGAGAPAGEPAAPAEAEVLPALHRACLWLEHHDLGAFVLLGDPAARLPRLPGEADPAAARAPASAPPAALASEAVGLAEADVLACLAGGQDPEDFAPSVGREGADLAELVAAYRDAGRRALAALLAARRR